MGTKSPRSQALELHHAGHSSPAIAKALRVDIEQVNTWIWGPPRKAINRKSAPHSKPRAISPASSEQREKVAGEPCLVNDPLFPCSGDCEPAHLIPRGMVEDSENDPLRIVPLCHRHHREYDQEQLDLLPYLEPRFREEVAEGVRLVGLITALNRISNDRFVSESSAKDIAIAAAEDALREAA